MKDTDTYLGSLDSLAFASEAAYGLDGEGRRHGWRPMSCSIRAQD